MRAGRRRSRNDNESVSSTACTRPSAREVPRPSRPDWPTQRHSRVSQHPSHSGRGYTELPSYEFDRAASTVEPDHPVNLL
jgi:hypothetical protein